MALQFREALNGLCDFEVQQDPVRNFFWHLRAVVSQLEGHPHVHPIIFIRVDRDVFKTSLAAQNVVAAVACNAKHIRTELFGRVDFHKIDVQGHQRVLHHILRFVTIADQAPDEPRQPRH